MFWMNPDNGCKDRNSSKGEKEVPMDTVFSYMDLQGNKQNMHLQEDSLVIWKIGLNNFGLCPANYNRITPLHY